MAIIQRDGLNFYDWANRECIVVESDRIGEYLSYIREKGIREVSLNDLCFEGTNLDFLSEISFIEELGITATSIKDYSGLRFLSKLRTLSFDEPQGKLDLSLHGQLEALYIEMNKNVMGLGSLEKLRTLRIWKYKSKSADLSELSTLVALEELHITQSPITSLNGCERLKNLKNLELNYLGKLERLDALEWVADTLKSLRFDCCKKITNHEYVTCLHELELLAFDACGDIPSIGFIKKLPKLKSFIFVNTNIVDGDLSPCMGLEYVGFLNKKHYSHKSEDFKTNK